MNEDYKKWLCELAEMNYRFVVPTSIEILIKAMWAINRECYDKGGFCICSSTGGDYYIHFNEFQRVIFTRKDHNNSEQEALQASLEYIFKETT